MKEENNQNSYEKASLVDLKRIYIETNLRRADLIIKALKADPIIGLARKMKVSDLTPKDMAVVKKSFQEIEGKISRTKVFKDYDLVAETLKNRSQLEYHKARCEISARIRAEKGEDTLREHLATRGHPREAIMILYPDTPKREIIKLLKKIKKTDD